MSFGEGRGEEAVHQSALHQQISAKLDLMSGYVRVGGLRVVLGRGPFQDAYGSVVQGRVQSHPQDDDGTRAIDLRPRWTRWEGLRAV